MAFPVKQCIFGGLDGWCTGIAVVVGSVHLALGLVLAVALAGALSMSWGEFEADNSTGWREALAMAVASFTGAAAPCTPILLLGTGTLGIALAVLVGILIATGAGLAKGSRRHRWRPLLISLAGFAFVAIPVILLGLLAA